MTDSRTYDRRRFLAGIAAAGAGALAARCGGGASPEQASTQTQPAAAAADLMNVAAGRRVDVHHHFTSPGWFKELEAANLVPGARRGWTPAKALEAMDKSGTQTALISTGQAGGAFTPERLKQRGVTPAQAAETVKRLAREANEYGTKMAADNPGRFILMASLPMPDLDASLKELAYALDTLKAGGAFLPTSFIDKYIGDPAFVPLLEELNRRKVTVYTHPTDAACCIGIIPNLVPNTIEYGTDTSRMIMSLIVNDAPKKFPDIKWIFSHAGGTLPFLVERVVGNDGDLTEVLKRPAEVGSRLAMLRGFYYDTAQTANSVAMTALKQVVGIDRIVFGTDFPYSTMVDHIQGLSGCGAFDAQELEKLYRGNIDSFVSQNTPRTT
jgi:predicted TIM-barrel fold metal-dependent hydrolase